MKISVITVAYNSAGTLLDAVASVLGQTHPAVEYLIVDGGSTDDTVAKLAPYRERIDCLISEPDKGMYDAMNKGIARATGDVVAILNSDDVYADSETRRFCLKLRCCLRTLCWIAFTATCTTGHRMT